VLALNKEFDAALADFAEAIRIDAQCAARLHAALRCLHRYGPFRRRHCRLNSVINQVPNAQYAMGRRAEAYMGKGNLDAALKDLNAVLALNPNNVRAHMDRGKLFERRGDLAAGARRLSLRGVCADEVRRAGRRDGAEEGAGRLNALDGAGPGREYGPPHRPDRRHGAYKSVPALDNPPRDAKLIAAALRDVGFQTVSLSTDLTRDKFSRRCARSPATPKRPTGRWCIMPAMASRWRRQLSGAGRRQARRRPRMPKPKPWRSSRCSRPSAGARRLRLVILDACRNNPFAPTMPADDGVEAGRQGFLQYRAVGRFHGGLCRQARRDPRWTARAPTVRLPAALARDIREPAGRGAENCSTSSATTSGRRPGTRSSPSPTARRRDARISTSWGESSRGYGGNA